MNRRKFLAGLTVALSAQSAPTPCLLLAPGQATKMRSGLAAATNSQFERFATSALKSGPWSVTSHRPEGLNVNAGPHDYYSEGPYWWPDPKNPKGPYIRKDGQRNPERFMGNRSDLGNMCTATLSLGLGAYFLKRPVCANHAAEILSTWFLDPATRMNPNLEYGQAIRGINDGRGTGIIDTVSLIHAVQGIMLLEQAGGFDPAISAGVRRWFTDYTTWLTTSKKGLDEKKSGNNHATWWTAQVAAYATFIGDRAVRQMAWTLYRDYLVPTEIQPDGSCPREEARTQSLSYSSMNLDAFSLICRLAKLDGVDLWHYRSPKGVGVETAFHYLTPFLLEPAGWKKEQITKYDASNHIFPGLAGVGLPSPELLADFRKIPRGDSPFVQFVNLLVETEA
jgi:hypothetical protein